MPSLEGSETKSLALYGGEPVRPGPIETTVYISPEAKAEIAELVDGGNLSVWHGGPQSHRFEKAFAAHHGPGFRAVAVNSGTSALHLALDAAGIGPGDEVIVPAACYVSAATAVVQLGGIPVICDIDPRTLTMDADSAAALVGPRTKAILPVHLWGYPVDVPRLRKLCDEHGLILIEDTSQAPGTRIGDKKAGMYGDYATYSFAFRKHVSTGDGGMVMTSNEEAAERVRVLANVGKGAGWEDYRSLGYSYRMVEFSALVGLDQLTRLDREIAARRQAAQVYRDALEGTGLQPAPEPDWGECSYFKLPILMPAERAKQRNLLIEAVSAENVSCKVPHPALWEIGWLAAYLKGHDRFRGAEECPGAASVLGRLFEVEAGPHLPPHEAGKSASAVTKVWDHLCGPHGA